MRAWILWLLVRWRLKRDNPTVIAVGGAIAKTSTKVAIGAVMQAGFPGQVRVGFGNLNTYLGVPLAILGFKIDFYKERIGFWGWLKVLVIAKWRTLFQSLPKYLVLEFGTDQTGDLDKITRKIQPDVAVITIVGPAHLANYTSEEAMAHDEGFLAERTKPSGVLFLNHADPYREQHRNRTKARVREIVTPLEIMATEYAKAVAAEFKIPAEQTTRALKNYQKPEHRFNEKKIGTWLVLDDSYNASPLAMDAALNKLQLLPGRQVAILGDMRELGTKEVEYHQKVGQLAKSRAKVVVGVGPLAKNYQPDHWFATAEDAAGQIFAILKDGDTVLVKGSHSLHLERIVSALENHHAS